MNKTENELTTKLEEQSRTTDRLFELTLQAVYDLMEDASKDKARPPVARDRLKEMKEALESLIYEFSEYQPFDD